MITDTAEATRQVLQAHRKAAVAGLLTLSGVVKRVRWKEPDADRRGIYQAIGSYGPTGEDDCGWYYQEQLTNKFYNPKTGAPLE